MPEQPAVWIMGACVVLFAAAMIAQAAAGFRMLRIIKPLHHKKRQLVSEMKHLIEMTEQLVRDAKPKVAVTTGKVQELRKMTTQRASEWKQHAEEITEIVARFRKSRGGKPPDIRTQPEFVVDPPEHKREEEC
jgi:hypothetical protein